jgi:hypothetical protein
MYLQSLIGIIYQMLLSQLNKFRQESSVVGRASRSLSAAIITKTRARVASLIGCGGAWLDLSGRGQQQQLQK